MTTQTPRTERSTQVASAAEWSTGEVLVSSADGRGVNPTPISKSAEWSALRDHHDLVGSQHLRDIFAADPSRGTALTATGCDLYLDYSKNRITAETIGLLVQLAERAGLRERIEAMFTGEAINLTEGRPVLHVALRASSDQRIEVDGRNVVPDVHAVLDRMASFAELVRSGKWRGHTGRPIRVIRLCLLYLTGPVLILHTRP